MKEILKEYISEDKVNEAHYRLVRSTLKPKTRKILETLEQMKGVRSLYTLASKLNTDRSRASSYINPLVLKGLVVLGKDRVTIKLLNK